MTFANQNGGENNIARTCSDYGNGLFANVVLFAFVSRNWQVDSHEVLFITKTYNNNSFETLQTHLGRCTLYMLYWFFIVPSHYTIWKKAWKHCDLPHFFVILSIQLNL
jgi:hypothetical protein